VYSVLENILYYLSENFIFALLIYFVLVFIAFRIYEKKISTKLKNKIKFLNNQDKNVSFEIFIIGFLFLAISISLNFYFTIPFIWFLCSVALTIGGILGILPFSFIKNK